MATIHPMTIRIDTVIDYRQVHPRVVGIDEVTHYSFIPVDQVILLKKPLTEMIGEVLHAESSIPKIDLAIGIKHLDLSHRSLFILFKQYRVNASVMVLTKAENDSLVSQGELISETGKTSFFIGSSLKKGYEASLQNWLAMFPDNVSSVHRHLNGISKAPYHYRPFRTNASWMRLRASGNMTWMTRGYMIDGQVYFTFPEAGRYFWRSAGLLRFRHQKDFDSMEWGLINTSMCYRLNQSWLSSFRCNILFGINRWKNMKTTNHELSDAMIGDISLVQSLHYFPRDARTLIFGLGLMQDMTYIYSKGLKFQFGLTLNIGVQL